MTVHHLANRPTTGTCAYCGLEKPDRQLAIYTSMTDMSWYGTCEECHDKKEVPVRFWELFRLSELRTGTAFFTRWWNRQSRYCGWIKD